jgi:hypothetical protein
MGLPRWSLVPAQTNSKLKKVNTQHTLYTLHTPHTPHCSLLPPQAINMAPADSAKIQEAQKLVKTDPRKAEAQYKAIISKPPSVTSEAAIREYETALVSLGELCRDEK